jgi:ribosomal protein L37E
MKLNGLKWLFKKKVVKTNNLKKCLSCPNMARNSMAKYCLECSYERELENDRIKKYNWNHRNKK